jgi:hypothetical protein
MGNAVIPTNGAEVDVRDGIGTDLTLVEQQMISRLTRITLPVPRRQVQLCARSRASALSPRAGSGEAPAQAPVGQCFFAADALKAHPGSGTVWHHISVKQLKLHPPMVHLLGCNAQEAQR